MSLHFSIETARRSRRAQVFMSGELVVGAESLKVTIRDISANGALIVSEKPLTQSCPVELKRGALSASGHVAWAHGKQAGVKFDDPVASEILEKTMPKALLRSLDIDPKSP